MFAGLFCKKSPDECVSLLIVAIPYIIKLGTQENMHKYTHTCAHMNTGRGMLPQSHSIANIPRLVTHLGGLDMCIWYRNI